MITDNGPDPATLALSGRSTVPLEFLSPKKNLGFGAGVNLGMRNVEKTIVVIMHSDSCLVDRKSLSNLYKDFISMRRDNVAMMTAITNNPQVNENILQRKNVVDEPPKLIINNFVPMYCCIIELAAWHSTQGIPEFPLAWFEDEAFCYKLTKLGYKIAISYKSFVEHKGSLTIKSLISKNVKNLEIMKSNIDLLNKIRK
jgi:GT2 family glycosyltransferase